jgi:uncharacterized protein (DUF2141 family)
MKFLAVAALLLIASRAGAAEADLSVIVTQLANDGASLNCALFSSAKGFPDARTAAAKTTAVVRGGRAECLFRSVVYGTYAVAAYEDRNGNQRLDTNWLGVPTEGIAFSRDARGRMGPPGFDAASFDHRGKATVLQLRANY